MSEENYCSSCSGTGEGQYDGTRCWVCKGRGIAPDREAEEERRAEAIDHAYNEWKERRWCDE